MCASFTRWIYRKGIDPDGWHPWWRRLMMYWLYSDDLYLYICTHPVWVEGKRKTDHIVWIYEAIANIAAGGSQ